MPEFFHCLDLVFRQQPRLYFVQADRVGDGAAHAFIVSGEHDGFADAKLMQPFQHLFCAFARGISQSHDADELPVGLDQHDGFAFRLETLCVLLNHFGDGFAVKQLGVTDGDFLSIEFGSHSFSGHGFGLTSLAPG